MRKHRHKAVRETECCFSGPVAQPENRAAHGNVCRTETCSCGAVRRTNVNQGHAERGVWDPPPTATEVRQ